MTADLLGGRYQILSPLRAGGMGEVFLVHDTGLERRVAVKLLPRSIIPSSAKSTRSATRAAARSTEYVEGETLHVSGRSGSCYKCSNCGTTSGCA